MDPAEPTPYVSPSAEGAYLAEHFDDLWIFERDWVMSKTPALADKQKGNCNYGVRWYISWIAAVPLRVMNMHDRL